MIEMTLIIREGIRDSQELLDKYNASFQWQIGFGIGGCVFPEISPEHGVSWFGIEYN